MAAAAAAAGLHPDTDTDPRELEAFAERFKQRRIKLGSYMIKLLTKDQFIVFDVFVIVANVCDREYRRSTV